MYGVNKLLSVSDGLMSIKTVSTQYGVSKSTLYELIKTDPTFPCVNVGLKKKLMIDAEKFTVWVEARTERQKQSHFGLSTIGGLLEKYRK